eukprot:CAMPEP_0194196748 /NCGR_PEP_ID=MMETSP0154-20130528/76836_1 /TAXON_ID=1049557 /ORGANISM="Thalassiothrix antarctica, Strain L6-D1" /LENGTH=507 /DNA_ID=CAMNT_0038921371 /DNA_START=134 /DNA_END=1654 /DNA_ORIENTATION=-
MSDCKKQKTTVMNDFDRLRDFILSCPTVPKESPAIKAALSGLDTELKRMERDAKLKRKFSMNTTSNNNNTTTTTTTNQQQQSISSIMKQQQQHNTVKGQQHDMTMKEEEEANTTTTNDNESLEEDWQDVSNPNDEVEKNKLEDTNELGNRLSQLAVTEIAKHGTKVDTPLAAIALALHAVLVSTGIGFVCTGIPEDETQGKKMKKKGGFAAPIRALPKSQFLPSQWDTPQKSGIALRYRRNENGSSAVLRVVVAAMDSDDTSTIQISLIPGSSVVEEEGPKVSFRIDDHLNLESFRTALKKGGVPPSLHYKALSKLFTDVCRTLDIGGSLLESAAAAGGDHQYRSNEKSSSSLPYTDATILQQPVSSLRLPNNNRPNNMEDSDNYYNPYETPTIRVFDNNTGGHFAGDLRPAGFFNQNDNLGGGNLMGPNHPMLRGGSNVNNPMNGGGFGMRPRFDPIGPPGGPQDLFDPQNPNNNDRRLRRPPPGGLGNPNHDHARPPNNFNNDNM